VCAPKHLKWEEGGDIREWINLPLHAVELLHVEDEEGNDTELPYRAGSRFVSLPFQASNTAPQDLPALVRQAAINIAECPAWRASQPKPPVELYTSEDSDFDSNTRVQLLRALTPMMHGVTSVHIRMEGFKLGGAEVQALGSISSTLTRLFVWQADTQQNFWPAVWAHLPSLQTLAFLPDALEELGANFPLDVAVLCSRAPRPFTVLLSPEGLAKLQQCQLAERCQVWGTPQVTIRAFVGPEDLL
jgi:hypothetical protein